VDLHRVLGLRDFHHAEPTLARRHIGVVVEYIHIFRPSGQANLSADLERAVGGFVELLLAASREDQHAERGDGDKGNPPPCPAEPVLFP
jgi:hypothetical protein